MHTRTESSTRINVQNLLIPVCFAHLFPGRNDQQVIYGKLVKILLPIIDPVNIHCLIQRDGACPDIHKLP